MNIITPVAILRACCHELIGEVNIGVSLGCSDHALMEFIILRNIGQVKTIVKTLNFKEVNFQFLKELVDGPPAKLPSGIKEQKNWQIFKDIFLRAKELSIHRCKKLGKEGRRPE